MLNRLKARFGNTGLAARCIAIPALADPVEACYDRGWTDGLPVTPPTEERVLEMLDGTARAPSDVVGLIPPNYAECTVEKAAINAVMAGCKPEYFTVVLNVIEAALIPEFNLHAILATTNASGHQAGGDPHHRVPGEHELARAELRAGPEAHGEGAPAHQRIPEGRLQRVALVDAANFLKGCVTLHPSGGAWVDGLLAEQEPRAEGQLVADRAVQAVDRPGSVRITCLHKDRRKKRQSHIQENDQVQQGQIMTAPPSIELVAAGQLAAARGAALKFGISRGLHLAVVGRRQGGAELFAGERCRQRIGTGLNYRNAVSIGSFQGWVGVDIHQSQSVRDLGLQGFQIA